MCSSLIFRQGKWGGFLYGLWNWIHFASFTFLLPSSNGASQTDRARGKPCRKNPCDTAQSISRAMTSRSIKDTCVRSIGRALKRGIPVSRRNQRGRLGENHGEVKNLWGQRHGRKMRKPLCSGESGTSSDNKNDWYRAVVYRNVAAAFYLSGDQRWKR